MYGRIFLRHQKMLGDFNYWMDNSLGNYGYLANVAVHLQGATVPNKPPALILLLIYFYQHRTHAKQGTDHFLCMFITKPVT